MNSKTISWKYWTILLIACGMAGSSLGLTLNVMGVFYQPVAWDLNTLVGTIAFHTTLSVLVRSIISLFIPKLLEHFKVRQLVVFGTVITAVSFIGMAFTSEVWMFNLLGILRGLGASFLSPVMLTILVNNWFEEGNSLVLSISMSFAGIIGVLMSPFFAWTIGQFGWRNSFIILGMCIVLINLPSFFVSYELYPEQENKVPYGYSFSEEETKNEKQINKKVNINPISITSLPFITLSVLALFFTYITGVIQNLPIFAHSIGLSSGVGAAMLSAAMLGNIVFKLLLGLTGEKLNTAVNVSISLILTFTALLILLYIRIPFILVAISFIIGSAYYVTVVGLPVLTNYFYGKRITNKIYPVVALMEGISEGLAVTVVAYLFDFTNSFFLILWLGVLFTAFSLGLLFISTKNKNNYG